MLRDCDSPYIIGYYGSYVKNNSVWIILETQVTVHFQTRKRGFTARGAPRAPRAGFAPRCGCTPPAPAALHARRRPGPSQALVARGRVRDPGDRARHARGRLASALLG